MPAAFPSRPLRVPTPARRAAGAAALAASVVCGLATGLAFVPAVASAERADRTKPMNIQADRSSTVDLQRQVTVFAGNVIVQQGTLLLKAERIELRETPEGWRSATAQGAAGAPASYRQKREGVDETVEGSADRIEYDARTETLRFLGNGVVRRLRGGTVADEITGALITWNHADQTFSVQGGPVPAPGAASAPGDGRVRVTLTPRPGAAAEPATRPPAR